MQLILSILFVPVLIAFIVFLYQYRIQSVAIDDIYQTSIIDANSAFTDYRDTEDEKAYLLGVSCFHTFKEIYAKSSYYENNFDAIISSAYAKLLFDPELTKKDVELLIDSLAILSEDCGNSNGYITLQTFVLN